MRLIFIVAALLASMLPMPGPAKPESRPVRLNGTVVSAAANALTLRTAQGNQTIMLGPKTRFFAVSKSSLDKVTKDSFIGTTVVPQPDNTYVSTEVHIFAPSLRGTGEGFTKMDNSGGHMMANSTVTTVSGGTHMMANSSVRSVGSKGGQKSITMVFPTGTIHVTIPANTPVTYISPGSRALLVSGTRVEVRAAHTASGLQANTIIRL
jgi:hypothetical protein